MDKAKKKRVKKIVTWVLLAALVAGLAAMPLLARTEAEEDGPKATIHSGTVETGTISLALHGGGTLQAEDAEDVELPSGVKITEFLVRNGDLVKKGDPVATVDTVSVMTAITGVSETLDYIREQLEDAGDEKVDSTVVATAGGRVKQVFAQVGDRVEDVMLNSGALAVLSLDGRMAVKLQQTLPLITGDSVTVTLTDGTALEGRVESNLDGVAVITVEDKGYEIGENVTVTTASGDLVGTGSLYVHSAWKATGYSGTVSTVYAKPEAKVSSGSTLFTLKDTEFRGDQTYLAGLHREYEELLKDLFAMYESGFLTAPCDGEISGVDTDSEYLLSAIDGEQGWFVDLLTNETSAEKGWKVVLLSNVEEEEDPCTGKTGCESETHEPGCPEICLVGEGCLATQHHDPNCIKLCNGTADCPAKVHQASCVSLCANNKDCTAISHRETCPWHTVTYSAYAGKVFAAGTGNLVVYADAATQYPVVAGESGWTLADPGTLKPDLMITETVWQVAEGSRYAAGDIVLLVTGVGTDGTVLYQNVVLHQKGQGPQMPDFGNLGGLLDFGNLAGLFGGMAGGMTGMQEETGPELFDLDGATLLTVTPRETVKLTIAVDEQEIAKVSPGQQATVKVPAIRDREFEAEVTEVGFIGTNGGGSSKFSVELTLAMDADMVPGMSATASIPLETWERVPAVPVAALIEDGAQTMVYTALDPETGMPASPVAVTVGVSDGETVQILSGLQEGDSYYYSYYDVLELSNEVEEEGFSFG